MEMKQIVLNAMGWPQYEGTLNLYRAAADNLDAANSACGGYHRVEAEEAKEAYDDVARVAKLFPGAAAYAQARSFRAAANALRSAAGLRAMERIEAGEDPALVVVEMKREWRAAAE